MSLAGQKIGKYYVIRQQGRAWTCICTCGREVDLTALQLRMQPRCEHVGKKKRHPIYMIWRGMKSRCYTKTDTSYPRYGAKGIRVDERWHRFENFFADFGHTWRKGLTIDRKDGLKDYGPDNCEWATVQQQNNNRNVNYQILVDGEYLTLQQAVQHFGVVNYKTAHARITKRNWDPLKAASTPSR